MEDLIQKMDDDWGYPVYNLHIFRLTRTSLRSQEVVKRKKKLREITADLFVASRRQNTSDSVDGDFRVIYSKGGLVWFSGYLMVG